MSFAVPAPSSIAGHTLGEAALTWASLNWGVFPIVPRGKTPYATGEFCERTEEHACGFHCASHDERQIAAWWTAHPDSNIGITGQDALFVDEDRIGALLEHDVHLPKCPWEITGRVGGGRHFFLKAPEAWPGLAGDAVKVTYRLAGVEVKGFDKGYVVAAPSVHASGVEYQLKIGGYVPECPIKVLDQLVEVTNVGVAPGRGALITVMPGGYQLPDSIGEGGRYEAIRSYTAHLYNRRFSIDEMWGMVRTQLAPRFATRLSERQLRDRFERATAELPKRLGDPRAAPDGAQQVALTDQPLTEFDSTPVQWLWSSWLPRGVVTLMDGNPGVAKSTLVADLVARITTGRAWPDGTPLETTGRVLWVTTEDDPGRVLRPRIEAAGGDASLVRFVTNEVVFPGVATAFQELLVARAKEPLGLALVILDPLFSHIDAKVRSIADADMRQNVMNPLGDAAEAAGVSILVVRHFNKDVTANPLNRGAGSLGGIVGAARALWSVTVDPEDESGETKAVGVTKLNYARMPMPLRYRVIDRLPPGWVTGSVSGIEWLGQAPVSLATMMSEPADVGGAVAALADLLARAPIGATAVHNLMRARGFGRDATRGAATRLKVVKTKTGMSGGWEWSLPEESGASAEESEESEESGADSSADSSDSSVSRARARTPLEPNSSDSSDSSKSRKSRVPGSPPAQARAREGEWLRPCRDYDHHRTFHRQLADGWTCETCDEEDGE